MLPARSASQDVPDAVFDALGNPVRREILRRLAAGPLNVGALAGAFTVSRPAISRHLAVLEAAGLVRHEPAGTRNVYALAENGFSVGARWLNQFWDEAEARLRIVAENLRD
jgi:DNA-binding transcriptional ArsR family regulator